MKLYEYISISEKSIISIVGGGGKTSLMYRLADELSQSGKRVIVSTTTKIYIPAHYIHTVTVTEDEPEAEIYDAIAKESGYKRGYICIGTPANEEGKLTYPGDKAIKLAKEYADYLIIEADGARHLPIKAPAEHEPVIMPDSNIVIAVAGLDAIGKPLDETCFRYETAAALLGCSVNEIVSPKLIARLITDKRGQFKNVPEIADFVVILNKTDIESGMVLAQKTAEEIKKLRPGTKIIATCLNPDEKECFASEHIQSM